MSIIIPFCIFRKYDKEKNIYISKIENPIKVKNKKLFICRNNDKEFEYYNTFYAFSPLLTPIPTGLKMFIFDENETDYIYDIYDKNNRNNKVSFITWSQPVSGTVPLYLHITPEGRSFPSFEKNPPENVGWKTENIEVIYVLVDSKYYNNINIPKWERDIYDRPIFKFKGIDNRCIPDINGVSIEKCFLLTDEDILHINKDFGPVPLLSKLQRINKELKDKRSLKILFKNFPNYIILIVILCIIISLTIIIFKNK